MGIGMIKQNFYITEQSDNRFTHKAPKTRELLSRADGFTLIEFLWVIILVIVVISVTLVVTGNSEDTIELRNIGDVGQEVGILVDGPKHGSFQNDYRAIGRSNADRIAIIPIGPFQDSAQFSGEFMAFTDGKWPVLGQVTWTDDQDQPVFSFQDPQRFTLAVWIVTGRFLGPDTNGDGDPDEINSLPQRANWVDTELCDYAKQVWGGAEGHSLLFDCKVRQLQSIANQGSVSLPANNGTMTNVDRGAAEAFFLQNRFQCNDHSAGLRHLVGTDGDRMLNIFYVNDVSGSGASGLNFGVWCLSQPDVIALGSYTRGSTLTHELSHAFMNDDNHTDRYDPDLFDQMNVMVSSSANRLMLTEGQVFRAVYQKNGSLHGIYNVGPGTTAGWRNCGPRPIDPALSNCPPTWKRVWPDGERYPPN